VVFFLLFLTVTACSSHYKSIKSPSNGNEITDIFRVMLVGVSMQNKPLPSIQLQFKKSEASDAMQFLKQLPIQASNIFYEKTYYEKKPYILSEYKKYLYVINFYFDKEKVKWAGKLHEVSFGITYPKMKLAEDETSVYKSLEQRYGKYTRVEKFKIQLSRGDQPETTKLNLYIWEQSNSIIAYKSIYDKDNKKTSVGVRLSDRTYYEKNPYYLPD